MTEEYKSICNIMLDDDMDNDIIVESTTENKEMETNLLDVDEEEQEDP